MVDRGTRPEEWAVEETRPVCIGLRMGMFSQTTPTTVKLVQCCRVDTKQDKRGSKPNSLSRSRSTCHQELNGNLHRSSGRRHRLGQEELWNILAVRGTLAMRSQGQGFFLVIRPRSPVLDSESILEIGNSKSQQNSEQPPKHVGPSTLAKGSVLTVVALMWSVGVK